MYDVVIIGAGVTGALIARELSKYRLKVLIVEKESDVAMATSKANSAIVHAGYDAVPGTKKALLNVRGNTLMGRLADELDVSFQRIGSLVLCFREKDIISLEKLKERGIENGVEGLKIIHHKQLKEMEPNLSSNAVAALYAPTAGIVCPYELTLHAAENAVENGVELKLECEVTGIEYAADIFHISTTQGCVDCKYLVNAAGLYSDVISRMAGDKSFSVHPRKGEYILMDKTYGRLVNRVIFQLPTQKGKGVLVTPTVDGNLLVGPNAVETNDREDTATTNQGLSEIIKVARKSAILPDKGTITSFSGLRAAANQGDFIIQPSSQNNKMIHAAGIESPGLTSAPAIGEMVVRLLKESGLPLDQKNNFNPLIKKRIPSYKMTPQEWEEAVKRNPAYGRIVCRCEKVSEADVIASIHRTIGAKSLDGVKRRTRAGMGRCQGGFCSPRIVEILSRELGIPFDEITKSGGSSKILVGKTK